MYLTKEVDFLQKSRKKGTHETIEINLKQPIAAATKPRRTKLNT